MRLVMLMLLVISLCSGCAAFKEDVGDYIKDSVIESVEKDVEAKLAARGLSIAEVTSDLDLNSGDPKKTIGAMRELAKDFVALEANKLLEAHFNKVKTGLVSKEQLDSAGKSHFQRLFGTCGTLALTLLGKYLRSRKTDKDFENRLKLLEKVTGQDLDGDGNVGDAPGNKA